MNPAFQVGWFRGKASSAFSLNFHKEVELQFLREGTFTYLIGNRRYPLRKSNLLVIPPHAVHQGLPQPGQFYEKLKLLFLPSLIPSRALKPILKFPQGHLWELSDRDALKVEMIFRSLKEEFESQNSYRTEMVSLEIQKLILILNRTQEVPSPKASHSPLLIQMLTHVEKHFSHPSFKLGDMARQFGYSEDHLSRSFKKSRGLPLKRFLLQRRMVEARRLLELEPALTLEAIAEKVGYSDLRTFRRSFKALIHSPPGSFRRALTPLKHTSVS